jgi:hypothetical protein
MTARGASTEQPLNGGPEALAADWLGEIRADAMLGRRFRRHRMSGRMRFNSLASASPLSCGMVWSVTDTLSCHG